MVSNSALTFSIPPLRTRASRKAPTTIHRVDYQKHASSMEPTAQDDTPVVLDTVTAVHPSTPSTSMLAGDNAADSAATSTGAQPEERQDGM